MPIVYTPVVGLACQHYSKIFRRPRGLFITIEDAGHVEELFRNYNEHDIKAIVVTDGERILGLGDLGAHGMGISVGKLALYSALGGIPPEFTLPVCIDVGTNNQDLLRDPYYIGLHSERTTGAAYDALIDEFMQTVVKVYGRQCLIQFEDFGNRNASRLLEKYRGKYCTFNDDIQGTASVTLAGVFAFNRITNMTVSNHTFLFQGAGTAATGIADLIVKQMMREGTSETEALSRIWMVDIEGLVTAGRGSGKCRFAKDAQPTKDLAEVVSLAKPTAIIGVSAARGAFTPEVLKLMAELNDRPLVMALSNPTSCSECTAEEAYTGTNGQCLFASGSPFDAVQLNGETYTPSQGNNAYIFPAMALAIMASAVKRISDEAFIVAAQALADEVKTAEMTSGRLYPRLRNIRPVSISIATKLVEYFYENGQATYRPEPENKYDFLKSMQYNPMYDKPLRK